MSTMTSPSPLRMRWIVGALVVCLLLHAVRVSAEDRRSSPDDISHFMNDSFKDRRGLADDGDKASDQEVDMNINTVHSPSIHTDMNTVYPSNTHRHHSVENLRDASEGLELMDGTPGVHGNEADPDFWRWGWSAKELPLAPKTWTQQPSAPSRPREKWPGFTSWTGQVSGHPTHSEKRQAFSAWAGKRSPHFHNRAEAAIRGRTSDDGDDGDVDDNRGKRPAFSAWGGKRSEDDVVATTRPALGICHDGQLEKRLALGAWSPKGVLLPSEAGRARAGVVKRSVMASKDKHKPARAQGHKRRFSAWGGKRSDSWSRVGPRDMLQIVLDVDNGGVGDAGYEGDDESQRVAEDHQQSSFDEDALSLKEKRQAFNAWGGKRSWRQLWGQGRPAGASDEGHSWDAQGSSQESTSLLRRPQLDKEFEETSAVAMHTRALRAAFSAWAGKRSSLLDVDREDTGQHVLSAKRQGFSAWGGK